MTDRIIKVQPGKWVKVQHRIGSTPKQQETVNVGADERIIVQRAAYAEPTPEPEPEPEPVPPPTGRPPLPGGAIWADDFNTAYPNPIKLDPAKWQRIRIFDGSLMARNCTFSDDPSLYEVANGILTLKAKRVSGQAKPFIAPFVGTMDRQHFPGYGIMRASIRYDRGHALWPAFWTLDPFGHAKELDIIEAYPEPSTPLKYQSTIHRDRDTQYGSGNLSSPADSNTAFHVYELEWRASFISHRVDGVEKFRFNVSVPGEEFYLLLNLAVGVHWNNTVPDATTPDNPALAFDWVGVWP